MNLFIVAIVALMLGASFVDFFHGQFIRGLYWACGAMLNLLVGFMKG